MKIWRRSATFATWYAREYAPSRACEGLGRSAYSRPGGAAPLCYPADVTGGMVLDWRKAHETNAAAN